jgi:branched-chain amino acid transport system permease protein
MGNTTPNRTAVSGGIGWFSPAELRALALIAGVTTAVMLPFVAKNFLLFQITMAMIYAIAILGLNILTGFNGQFSLGHSAFYAIGAYTAAIMMEHGGLAYYWTLPAAGIICFAVGFLFGLPALRLEAIYLALVTFALAIATPQLLKADFLDPWTGGVEGIVITKPDAPFGLPLNSDQWLYCFTLGVAVLLYICAVNLIRSRTGRALIAIRDHPIAASAMGVNVALYKSLTFGVSALYTGVAGALGAIAVQFVAPDSFTFALAVAFFVGLVVGGVGSIAGTLFGALFILFVPNVAEQMSKGLAGAVYGVILILVIYAMPAGAAGLLHWLASRAARRGASPNCSARASGATHSTPVEARGLLPMLHRFRPAVGAKRRYDPFTTPQDAALLQGGDDEETHDVDHVRRHRGGDREPGIGSEEVRSGRD